MLKKGSGKNAGKCRKAALGLLAIGVAYAAPAILPLNSAMAATGPSSLGAKTEMTAGYNRRDRRRDGRDGSRRSRPSRYSRDSRDSRPSRNSRDSRDSRYSRDSRDSRYSRESRW